MRGLYPIPFSIDKIEKKIEDINEDLIVDRMQELEVAILYDTALGDDCRPEFSHALHEDAQGTGWLSSPRAIEPLHSPSRMSKENTHDLMPSYQVRDCPLT